MSVSPPNPLEIDKVAAPRIRFWRLDSAARTQIVADLYQAGFGEEARHPYDCNQEALVLFTELDDGLCDLVHEVSCYREERVLAVCVSQERIGHSGVWRLLRAGASDVLWMESPAQIVGCISARIKRWRAVDELAQTASAVAELIGTSRRWRNLIRQVVEVAHFTKEAVLLQGESGTGKELIGRLIYQLDPAASARELALVDCTTIVPELSGSEFFGHERGAFTGAVTARDGAFAAANGGVLFLDEVGDLPAALQAQLLRVIQEGSYKRVGSDVWRHSHFRLVSATHHDLSMAIEEGRFRHDLYHRIAGWVLRIPPLRDRPEDILPLARHFLRRQSGDAVLDFDGAVAAYLQTRAYPGNVRELRQLVARIVGRHVGPGPVTAGDLPEDEWPAAEPMLDGWRGPKLDEAIESAIVLGAGLREISHAAADAAAHIALRRESGNIQAAAHALRVTDRALQMRRAAWREP